MAVKRWVLCARDCIEVRGQRRTLLDGGSNSARACEAVGVEGLGPVWEERAPELSAELNKNPFLFLPPLSLADVGGGAPALHPGVEME